MAQGNDQAVVERIALGAAREADDGNLLLIALEFKVDVFLAHGVLSYGLNYGYKK
jgi:hypothetical protein